MKHVKLKHVKLQCPVCGEVEEDHNIRDHTHWFGDRVFKVKLTYIVPKLKGTKYGEYLLTRPPENR